MQMMKTSLSRAFSSLPNNKYRVGFFTINSSAFGNTTIAKSITGSSPNRYSSNNFLDIALWDDTQKEYWYNTMLKANPTGGTPLRQALSRAGLIYAHMLKGASDPVEESCQQNFTILSTDGYWNGNGGSRVTGGTPAAPTTTSMNDQDGVASHTRTATVLPIAVRYGGLLLRHGLAAEFLEHCTSGATRHLY
jgi:type IV pilus assembly protein PilY1